MGRELYSGDAKPIEEILLPFITGESGMGDNVSFETLLTNAINQIQGLESAARDALVNSLTLLLLTKGVEAKFEFLSKVQTLSDLGFGVTPTDAEILPKIEAAPTAQEKVVIIAEYIARKLLAAMGEEIPEN